MHKSRFLFILLVVGVCVILALKSKANMGTESNQVSVVYAAEKSEPRVILTSDQSTTSWDTRDAVRTSFELPLLFLHQNCQETAESERTLKIVLTGIDGGRDIDVEIISNHMNVEAGMKHGETQRFASYLLQHSCDWK